MNLIHGTTSLRGNRLVFKVAIAMVATGALALGATAPANAETQTPPLTASSEIAQIDLASESISGPAGSVVFDYAAAVEAGVSVQIANDFAAGITAGGGVATNAPAEATVPDELLDLTAAKAASCQGRNGASTYWWGSQVRLDSCNANVVINAIWAGAGAAALAGILSSETGVGGIAGAVGAAFLTIGAGALGICAAWGTGIYINQVWASPPGCWAQ